MQTKKSGLYVVSNHFSAYRAVDSIDCLVPQKMSPEDVIIVLTITRHDVSEINSDYVEVKFLQQQLSNCEALINVACLYR